MANVAVVGSQWGDEGKGKIVDWLSERADVVVEVDRELAIRRAIDEAGAGEIVLIAGKGHETTQESGGEIRHFDDREIARAALGVDA